MSQKQYILDVLEKFKMSDCKPVSTPLEVKKKSADVNESELKPAVNCPYQNLIGSLMYLVVNTRPDVAYSVSYLSQFNRNPKEIHWKNAKRVLRYLKGTLDLKLVFKKTGKQLIGYADADLGGAEDKKILFRLCILSCKRSYFMGS